MTTNNKKQSIPSLAEKSYGSYLGAAIGDALGWPNERRSKRKSSAQSENNHDFFPWIRHSGGRFFSHEETINLGNYSDDTQLILATSRSLLSAREWWNHLSYKEFPFWSIYERGGGGATKRATNSWLRSKPPWSASNKTNDTRRYFEAGGNGVAMRILPHCLIKASSNKFAKISHQIMTNGVITHGHPRALAGALVYGYALWNAINHKGTLEYGTLLNAAINNEKDWGKLPDISDTWPGWIDAAQGWSNGSYKDIWKKTVTEITEMLYICSDALSSGALAVDRQVMEKIGAYDTKINGAGTIAGTASIFLSSRYASDPIHGLIDTAFARGTDTDTIASMTGGLLGAICGSTWLSRYSKKVQDAKYIKQISGHIADKERKHVKKYYLTESDLKPVKKSDINKFVDRLRHVTKGDTIIFPDSREAIISNIVTQKVKVKNVKVIVWHTVTMDGQSLYIKYTSRDKFKTRNSTWKSEKKKSNITGIKKRNKNITRLGIKLPVKNIEKSQEFYNGILGLKIVRKTKKMIILEEIITLVQNDKLEKFTNYDLFDKGHHFSVFIETSNFENVFSAVQKSGVQIIRPVTKRKNRKYFSCLDPDENRVDIYDAQNTLKSD